MDAATLTMLAQSLMYEPFSNSDFVTINIFRASASILDVLTYYALNEKSGTKIQLATVLQLPVLWARKYTLASAPIVNETTRFTLLVADARTVIDNDFGRAVCRSATREGRVSAWLRRSCEGSAGDMVAYAVQSDSAVLPLHANREVVWIGGGAGCAMLRGVLDHRNQTYARIKRIPRAGLQATFIAGVRSMAEFDFIFGNLLRSQILCNKIVVALSRESKILIIDSEARSVIDVKDIDRVYIDRAVKECAVQVQEVAHGVVICGGRGFYETVQKCLDTLGVKESIVIKEVW